MQKTELFLLLPEYIESSKREKYMEVMDNILDEEQMTLFLKNISDMLNFFQHEAYNGYYDSENIIAFLYPIELLEECYPNQKSRLRTLLRAWGEDWRDSTEQIEEDSFQLFDYLDINKNTLSEIAKRKALDLNSSYLLVNHNAMSSVGSIKVIYNQKDCQKEINIDIREIDLKQIAQWFELYRKPQRIFNLNPKHGENGKGAHRNHSGGKVSLLWCSKEEAYDLLNKAVAEGEDIDTLYYFDKNHDRFIEFKRELNTVYHGFHLDDEDKKRVPKGVIEKIELLKNR